jgi:hypothetical protein
MEDKFVEMYEFKYTNNDGAKVSLCFKAADLYDLSYNMLRFVKACGFEYVDLLEMSTPAGEIYRAKTL